MFSSDDWDPDRMMDGRYDGMMGGGGAWMMVLVGLLLLGLVAAIAFWAVRASGAQQSTRTSDDRPRTSSAREVLDLRLARGEISPEEYETIRARLAT
jgi:putative membrane protein